ncbi:L-cysteine desulfidase family protein [Fusibacter ferrireducens]|uniref:UPF0597 protein ISU02_08355 n=1 Tax=Fusibacter ferrireducens TaxID=2785058 RepID=A0ABR9ZRQ7_9FIRM|nr:L-serine ammonia-lyase, iron-sulfur-dependent, subunit alpha [Fusibacter ferrireducens]MBF4693129.1 serine dehydratase subunit alpha family protein [Fusibacter ferrireducens]
MENEYGEILKKELILALGCTEPISIAYAAALAKSQLGSMPKKIEVSVSGNIIKNVKGVIVPNTSGMRGIEVAVVAGLLSSKPESKLEVLEHVSEENISKIKDLLKTIEIRVIQVKNKSNLYVEITEYSENEKVCVVIENKHTNVTSIKKNDLTLHDLEVEVLNKGTDYTFMSYSGITEFAFSGDYLMYKDILDQQIEKNYGIAQIGLSEDFGMNIGKTLIKTARSAKEKSVAYAAAGSDARMSGSSLPVVINSGSGNQGMTVSLPIYVYCISEAIETEKMYRALIFANLIAIYIKSKIGSLSAFCGAVSAATAVSGAITYLRGGTFEAIENSIKNAFSNLPGVICDGAKPSCAYKIYSSLDSAFLASDLALKGIVAENGCGIIFESVDKTISAVGEIGNKGMKSTDEVILDIMTSW